MESNDSGNETVETNDRSTETQEEKFTEESKSSETVVDEDYPEEKKSDFDENKFDQIPTSPKPKPQKKHTMGVYIWGNTILSHPINKSRSRWRWPSTFLLFAN